MRSTKRNQPSSSSDVEDNKDQPAMMATKRYQPATDRSMYACLDRKARPNCDAIPARVLAGIRSRNPHLQFFDTRAECVAKTCGPTVPATSPLMLLSSLSSSSSSSSSSAAAPSAMVAGGATSMAPPGWEEIIKTRFHLLPEDLQLEIGKSLTAADLTSAISKGGLNLSGVLPDVNRSYNIGKELMGSYWTDEDKDFTLLLPTFSDTSTIIPGPGGVEGKIVPPGTTAADTRALLRYLSELVSDVLNKLDDPTLSEEKKLILHMDFPDEKFTRLLVAIEENKLHRFLTEEVKIRLIGKLIDAMLFQNDGLGGSEDNGYLDEAEEDLKWMLSNPEWLTPRVLLQTVLTMAMFPVKQHSGFQDPYRMMNLAETLIETAKNAKIRLDKPSWDLLIGSFASAICAFPSSTKLIYLIDLLTKLKSLLPTSMIPQAEKDLLQLKDEVTLALELIFLGDANLDLVVDEQDAVWAKVNELVDRGVGRCFNLPDLVGRSENFYRSYTDLLVKLLRTGRINRTEPIEEALVRVPDFQNNEFFSQLYSGSMVDENSRRIREVVSIYCAAVAELDAERPVRPICSMSARYQE
jgi:hypothetical protein